MLKRTSLSILEVADLRRCHPNTVRRAIRAGVLPARISGGRYVIERTDLDRFEPWRFRADQSSDVRVLRKVEKLVDATIKRLGLGEEQP